MWWSKSRRRHLPESICVTVRVFHEDAFTRKVPDSELPLKKEDFGRVQMPAVDVETSFDNESLAILEVMVVNGVSNETAAVLLRSIAKAFEESPVPFIDRLWSQPVYDVVQKRFVKD